MIDKTDKKTIDAFPVKKRGRPSTGNAMTGAQRASAKRERDRAVVREARYQADYEALTNTALLEALADAVSLKCKSTFTKITAVLAKRIKDH